MSENVSMLFKSFTDTFDSNTETPVFTPDKKNVQSVAELFTSSDLHLMQQVLQQGLAGSHNENPLTKRFNQRVGQFQDWLLNGESAAHRTTRFQYLCELLEQLHAQRNYLSAMAAYVVLNNHYMALSGNQSKTEVFPAQAEYLLKKYGAFYDLSEKSEQKLEAQMMRNDEHGYVQVPNPLYVDKMRKALTDHLTQTTGASQMTNEDIAQFYKTETQQAKPAPRLRRLNPVDLFKRPTMETERKQTLMRFLKIVFGAETAAVFYTQKSGERKAMMAQASAFDETRLSEIKLEDSMRQERVQALQRNATIRRESVVGVELTRFVKCLAHDLNRTEKTTSTREAKAYITSLYAEYGDENAEETSKPRQRAGATPARRPLSMVFRPS